MRRFAGFLALHLLVPAIVAAAELHVAVTGEDSGPGTAAAPLLTVNRAAQRAEPGDTVVVHAGVYRELVAPARGGEPGRPITYRAAAGEAVRLTGSERVTTWTREAGGVWTVSLPAAYFGAFNPYTTTVAGSYMTYGQWHHRGDVYCDDEGFTEVANEAEVAQQTRSWTTSQVPGGTRIAANFGDLDPNRRLTEINVRPMVFWPAEKRLDHITVQGFTIDKAATAWAPPDAPVQEGAIGSRGGAHWTIERCTIRYARCVGIAIGLYEPSPVLFMNSLLGMGMAVPLPALSTIGHHRITANRIQRCGQAGVTGLLFASASRITGNLVEEINHRQEFGGYETAALKFHLSADLVIDGNLLRAIRGRDAAYGVWIDFANVNTRLTRNAILDTDGGPWLLEMNHGPLLVDRNLLIGGGGRGDKALHFASAGNVGVRNLFVGLGGAWTNDQVSPPRQAAIFSPHSVEPRGPAGIVPGGDRWLGNVFVARTPDWPVLPGFIVDANLYLAGAQRPDQDRNGLASPHNPAFAYVSDARGLRISWDPGTTTTDLPCPPLTSAAFGNFAPVGMRAENPDGSAVAIDRDFFGVPYKAGRGAGPFAKPGALRDQLVFDAEKVGAPAGR